MTLASTPLVTVITPTYNRRDYIVETVESVLRQDYPRIEYIVLDDGSVDNTAEVLKPYLDRLTYLRHDNMGETKTVNKGYALALGEFIMVVNSDDPLYTEDAVSLLARCLTDHPECNAIYPDWIRIDHEGHPLGEIRQVDFDITNMLLDFNVTLGPGMLIRTQSLRAIGLRNETLRYTGDLDVSFRLALVGKLCHLKTVVATHREHHGAASSAQKGDRMADEVLRLAVESLKSPLLPRELLRRKNIILCRAYTVALCYFSGLSPRREFFRILQWYYTLASRLFPPLP